MVTWSSKKICCPFGRAGSSPATGTMMVRHHKNRLVYLKVCLPSRTEKGEPGLVDTPNNCRYRVEVQGALLNVSFWLTKPHKLYNES